jgi:hypothetical protein
MSPDGSFEVILCEQLYALSLTLSYSHGLLMPNILRLHILVATRECDLPSSVRAQKVFPLRFTDLDSGMRLSIALDRLSECQRLACPGWSKKQGWRVQASDSGVRIGHIYKNWTH